MVAAQFRNTTAPVIAQKFRADDHFGEMSAGRTYRHLVKKAAVRSSQQNFPHMMTCCQAWRGKFFQGQS